MKKAMKIIGWVFLSMLILGNIGRFALQTKYNNSLEGEVAKANRSCPMPFDGGVVTAIKAEGRNVAYYIRYDEPNDNPMLSEKNSDDLKETLVTAIMSMGGTGHGEGEDLVDQLISSGYGLKVVFSDAAGKSAECVVTAAELKSFKEKFREKPSESVARILEKHVAVERAALPQKIDEGMVITDYVLSGGNIVVTISLDEELYSISQLKEQEALVKDEILSEARLDSDVESLFELCRASNTGLVYRMVGTRSKRHCDITIYSNEL